MSAGICLMNKSCVVLAADSAITIGERESIFNSADKVFRLSENYPIGCIIYQNMEFMDIPIGVLLKKYRTDIDQKSLEFDRTNEYFQAFEAFLSENSDFFRFKENEFRFIFKYYIIIRDEFKKEHKVESDILIAKKQNNLDPDEIDKATIAAIKTIKNRVHKFRKVSGYDVKDYIIEKYSGSLKELFNEWFKNMNLKDEHLVDLIQIMADLIESEFKINEYTGINLAGYGKNQIFPSSVHYRLYGIINGKIKYDEIEKTQIDEKKSSSIKTLAQSDVIELFAYGINNSFLQNIGVIAKETLDEKLDKIKDVVEEKEKRDEIKKYFESTHGIIRDKVRTYAWENYLSPLEKSIAYLPNDEIVQLAEEMINLTSLRRKIIADNLAGTVGGPVDIAVIDLDNGFQWKCKKKGFENNAK